MQRRAGAELAQALAELQVLRRVIAEQQGALQVETLALRAIE